MKIQLPLSACVAALVSVALCPAIGTGAGAKSGPRSYARSVIADSQVITPGGIQKLEAVELGGIKQWISIRGNDPKNPLLLFLHGGPGSPMMAESWTFQRPWEDFFTVVQWDQRGSGKTLSAAGRRADPAMNVERMQADAEELIQYLRRTYGQDRIFLLGHSWGSVLGVKVAQHHPEWLYAYIGVGQVTDMRRNEAVGYQLTLDKARAEKNTVAIRELESIAPYPEADGSVSMMKVITERKWDITFGGMLYGRSVDNEDGRRSLSPDYSDYDVQSAGLGEFNTVKALWPQLHSISFEDVRRFDIPIFIFAGDQDRTTPTSLAKELFERIQAPRKKLIEVPGAAHYPFLERPGVFLLELVREVRPLADEARGH